MTILGICETQFQVISWLVFPLLDVGEKINKNKLTLKPPIGSTMMACPKPVMDQEQQYFSLLETAETFQIQHSRLTISSSGNQILVFAAQ
jgi:heat shock protein HslJ